MPAIFLLVMLGAPVFIGGMIVTSPIWGPWYAYRKFKQWLTSGEVPLSYDPTTNTIEHIPIEKKVEEVKAWSQHLSTSESSDQEDEPQ